MNFIGNNWTGAATVTITGDKWAGLIIADTFFPGTTLTNNSTSYNVSILAPGQGTFFGKRAVVNNNGGNYTIPAGTTYVGFTGTQAASVLFTFPAAASTINGLPVTIFTHSAVGTASTWASAVATFVDAPATLAAASITKFIYDHASLQWLRA